MMTIVHEKIFLEKNQYMKMQVVEEKEQMHRVITSVSKYKKGNGVA